MAPQPRRCVASDSGAVSRSDTLWPASFDRPRYCGSTTCVHGHGRSERPDGRQHRSSARCCAVSSPGTRGSPAGHIREGSVFFICVTTRVINFVAFNDLGCGFGSLTALLLCLSVARSGCIILAIIGLTPRRLPTADLPLTLGGLAVALVPAPRQVFPITPFAQASPLPRSTRSGWGPVMWINVAHAHGSCNSQGKARGECVRILLGRSQDSNETLPCRATACSGTRQRSKRL
jgi:hypothetical protein